MLHHDLRFRILPVSFLVCICAVLFMSGCETISNWKEPELRPLNTADTVATGNAVIGEPFGIAVRSGETFVSDGSNGKLWRIVDGGPPVELANGLNTPSGIAFNSEGELLVADSGSHTIKKISTAGEVSVFAGAEGQRGDADGPAASARFNAPTGLVVAPDGAVVVADTYNDKIKVIRDGRVSTVAGSIRGYAEGTAASALFDTPCAVAALPDGSLLVADTGNSRLRLISPAGNVSTLSGGSEQDIRDGTLSGASFDRPQALAVGPDGSIYIGDDNSVRAIRNRPLPYVETLSDVRRGHVDGPLGRARFNRVSGIAVSESSELFIADSDNAAVRRLFGTEIGKNERPRFTDRRKLTDPAEFRSRQPGRWPYDPPAAARDIAGTLGEIRNEYLKPDSYVRFHNGLDIAGAYGETARFVRDETVLDPLSVENFETSRELIRLPTIGYIHIRLGRDASGHPFGDDRFQFDPGIKNVRVPRGAKFRAGEPVGTLNSMNHVHMIAGPNGDEVNALDALILPGVADSIAPTIEDVKLYDRNWQPIETSPSTARITLANDTRIVVRAFDRMDGNPERRRLGVFRLGYQVLDRDLSAVTDINWNISFDRNPSPDAVKFAYAIGSKSGPTGETIFRYIVTNTVNGEAFSEGFFQPSHLEAGGYVLRTFAADYFGNTSTRDINFEVAK